MHRGTWNKRMAAAETRIREAGMALLKKAKLPKAVKEDLIARNEGAAHHNADIRRLKRFEALADLVEAAVDPKAYLERIEREKAERQAALEAEEAIRLAKEQPEEPEAAESKEEEVSEEPVPDEADDESDEVEG